MRPALLALGVLLTACASQESRRGSPDVYQRIEATTDCASLQETFDRAAVNNDRAEPGSAEHGWTTDYMGAAHDRMEEIGCYDR